MPPISWDLRKEGIIKDERIESPGTLKSRAFLMTTSLEYHPTKHQIKGGKEDQAWNELIRGISEKE